MRLLILVFIVQPLVSICADPASITQEELVRRSQELFDAVVPGNKEPWQKYFADDCIFADEKGRNFNKTQLIADIAPLPKGYSGTIRVVKPQSVIHRDTAILSYDLDETETIFGQKLTARYHVTDTWLRRNGVWQIASSQAMRYYEDPAIGRSDPKKFGDFDGTYEVAPGQIRRVFTEGENLYLERNGKREQLLPEGSEIFFRKGVEGRILFRYAANGRVDALIDRRNNEDVVWRRKD
ncbi:MAG TPA: nuclear transport factor 2 family protein [Candidatus Udaeobacter sp.]|nr:nuclear transport factor 2 family protein [Candidatus Udaeobacter sp.]